MSDDLVARDLKNDAEWLRTIADESDILPDGDAGCATVTIDSANQWLWPETRDNLRDIATAIETLERRLAAVLGVCDRLARLATTYKQKRELSLATTVGRELEVASAEVRAAAEGDS
jgi:hypothetical protein